MDNIINFIKMVSGKQQEMIKIMERNNLVLDNLNEPMQKLAFTFYSEIAEMSHNADILLEEISGSYG